MDRANDVGALVGAVIQRMWKPMFKRHQAIWDRRALMVRGLELADVAVRTFDGGKGAQLSTWISLVVWRGFKTEHRTCEREAARNLVARGKSRFEDLCRCGGLMAKSVVDDAAPCTCVRCGAKGERQSRSVLPPAPTRVPDGLLGRDLEDVDESLPLNEWAGAIYRQAVQTVGKQPTGRGTRCYEPAQEAALIAIQKRLKLSNRGVISFLEDREDVIRSIRLKHLPHHTKFSRLWCRISPPSANNSAAARPKTNRMASAYITEKQAAVLVGMSWTTLRRWRKLGNPKFPYYKPGGRIRYKRVEVEVYMEAQAVRPAEGARVA